MGPVSDSQGQVQKARSTRGTTQKTPPIPACEKTMCVLFTHRNASCTLLRQAFKKSRKRRGKIQGDTLNSELFHMYQHDFKMYQCIIYQYVRLLLPYHAWPLRAADFRPCSSFHIFKFTLCDAWNLCPMMHNDPWHWRCLIDLLQNDTNPSEFLVYICR